MSLPLLDVASTLETDQPEPDFIFSGFLTKTVGALISPGATGKSMWALQAAAAIASPDPAANTLGLAIHSHGPVLYLNLEDPESELARRVRALGKQLSPGARKSVAANFQISPLRGAAVDLLNKDFKSKVVSAGEGKRLIIIDTLSRSHKRDENSNADMSQLVAELDSIERDTGAAILFLHHTNKLAALSGQGATQQAARGASALIDNARWCGNLVKMSEDEARSLFTPKSINIHDACELYVKFEVTKQNYGRGLPLTWYKRTGDGLLSPAPANADGTLKGPSRLVERKF